MHDCNQQPNGVGLADPPGVAARNLSISRAALYRLISSGEIESFKVGASRRISRDAQRRFIARREAAQ